MILVTGSGLLGTEVIRVLSQELEVVGTYNSKPKAGAVCLDITDRSKVFDVVGKTMPFAIVHTAALTNVDYCEDHREEAMSINALGTKNVADAAKKYSAKMIYVSTDFVFDGKSGMYHEDDPVNPISYYAYTKLLGEYYVLGLDHYVIARTSVVYGNARQNFVTWVRDSLKSGTRIKVVDDQFNTPTLSVDCAEAIRELINNNARGIYHAAGAERLSRYDFARQIAAFYGLDENLIEPVSSVTLNQRAKRPMDSSLDTTKINEFHTMLDIRQGLSKMDTSGD
ncbi:MAG TPA: dTDP-4-dehydrorhamnose reductase [Methanocellaceae archaeon]|jgi:dTDP-4-dehydrorhamnose reductase